MEEELARISTDAGLAWAKLDSLIDGFFRSLPNLVIGLIVFFLVLLIGRAVRGAIRGVARRRGRPDIGQVFGSLAYWAVAILAVLVAMTIIFPSVRPVDLLATLGVGSVAIGFAFKDVLQNLLAGVLILVRQPFRRGDQIVAGTFEGTVEHIQARATLIRTYDGRRVVIPNADIYTRPIVVNTAFDRRRSEAEVGIGYGDDIAEARAIILDAMRGIDGILPEPAPDVLVSELAASWVSLRVRWWTAPDRATVLRVRDQVLARIKQALPAAGIDLPYDTKVVLFHDQTEETDGDRRRQREGWPAGGKGPPRPRWRLEAAMRDRAEAALLADGPVENRAELP